MQNQKILKKGQNKSSIDVNNASNANNNTNGGALTDNAPTESDTIMSSNRNAVHN